MPSPNKASKFQAQYFLKMGGWIVTLIIVLVGLMILSLILARSSNNVVNKTILQQNQVAVLSEQALLYREISNSIKDQQAKASEINLIQYGVTKATDNIKQGLNSIKGNSLLQLTDLGKVSSTPEFVEYQGTVNKLIRYNEVSKKVSPPDSLQLDFISAAEQSQSQLNALISLMNRNEDSLFQEIIWFNFLAFLMIIFLLYWFWYKAIKPMVRGLESRNDVLMNKSKELDVLAHTDALTEIKNRQYFTKTMNVLTDAENGISSFSLIMMDLNHFKAINDSYGHDVGDLLLQQIGKVLTTHFPKDQVMRLGGDEFAIIDVHSDKETIAKLLDDVVEHTAIPIYHNGSAIQGSISAGIAMYPDDAKNQEDLMRRADTALYKAKTYQGDQKQYCFFYDLGLLDDYKQPPTYHDFMNGIANGEFAVHYSPQFSLRTGNITGAEALVRWRNPVFGKYNVENWIGVAEQLGIITKITNVVLEDIGRLYHELSQLRRKDFKIGINFSGGPREIEDSVQAAINLINRQPTLADNLVVEITEKVIFGARGSGLSERLDPLRDLGVKISLDDFGTGFASLTHLTEIEFDVLKIDRTFVRDMQESYTSMNIIKSMISLSHALKKEVIAEGIETDEQRLNICALGCDMGQGYYISKPIARAKFVELIKASPRLSLIK
jgi:diguanylate cyclase (GGDEF)-like protein